MSCLAIRKGSLYCGIVLGIIVGATPLSQAGVLSGKALWTLGLGLALTYSSIGFLVAVLPNPFGTEAGRTVDFLFGFLIGAAYSLPGAVFTMVPYPLAETAPAYWKEFADGGIRAFTLTILFGGLTGGIAGLFRKPIRST